MGSMLSKKWVGIVSERRAGIHRKPFTADQSGFNASLNNTFKN